MRRRYKMTREMKKNLPYDKVVEKTPFHDLDTEASVYWFGFYCSAGRSSYGTITFKHRSKRHLEKLTKFIKASDRRIIPKIKQEPDKEKDSCYFEYSIQSLKLTNDLKGTYAIPPRKIPQELMSHFIRGFIDGHTNFSKEINEKYYYKRFKKLLNASTDMELIDAIYKDAHIYYKRKKYWFDLKRRFAAERLKRLKRAKSAKAIEELTPPDNLYPDYVPTLTPREVSETLAAI